MVKKTGVGKCPKTSPKYWGYNIIYSPTDTFSSDVKQIPKMGHLPNSERQNIFFSSDTISFQGCQPQIVSSNSGI